MRSLLALILMSSPALAQELTFAKIHRENLTGLSAEYDAQKYRDDASAYAFYRRFPKTARATEVWQNCYESNSAYFFCDMILNERPKTAGPGTEKTKRKKFFDALLSLDDENARERNCPAARKILGALAEDAAASSLHARADYWLWVCAGVLKDGAEAARLRDLMVKRFPVSHHTLLILQTEDFAIADDKDWPVAFRSESVPEINPYIAGIEAAKELKEDGAAAVFGSYINAKLAGAEPAVRLYMADLMSRVSASIPSVLPVGRVLVPLFQTDPEFVSAPLLKLLFPYDYAMAAPDPKKKVIFRDLIETQRGELEAPLLAGLLHQESALNPRAASAAGAYGLAQMLIGTANDQWRQLSANPSAVVTPAMLQDASFAVKLGAADLQRRLKNFGGNVVLAIASYNAGETGVKNWLKEVKEIKDQQILADVLFMNRMQAETHVPQYVSAVLGKAYLYKRLYP
jgi:soluble lytic murein transglycosylase-like protein